jgi:hypothetical protein
LHVTAEDHRRIELAVSEQKELTSLGKWLATAPGAEVSRVAGRPGAGEQGALDTLTVLGGSGALIAAVRVLPQYLRSRRTGLRITMKFRGEEFTLEATNIDDIMPVLERLLDD